MGGIPQNQEKDLFPVIPGQTMDVKDIQVQTAPREETSKPD
jgi:hypothetical protein